MEVEDFEAEYDDHVHDLGEDTPPSINMAADADRRLRSIRYWQGELDKVEALAEAEMQRVEAWLAKHEVRIRKRIHWNRDALQIYLWGTDQKTIDLPSGKLKRRKGRERIDIVLEETFLQWAEHNKMEDMIRIKRSPDKKAVAAYVKESGEEPPGVELNVSEDTFSVDIT